ncbi:hypothetical protein TEA_021256 [Camellia sinensis var. sinensis]|uniref:Phospholipid/glycerol acyltransferase domain-containing protein n=1 Tax=Camellia sinensis var. sinensis TaxID=542762 RepID=A0A4S4DIA9_CAMSN|nr:hypothetical protein TEA_021256 [Camellia sinensis var. sinensis]
MMDFGSRPAQGAYFPVHVLLKGHDKLRKKLERCLVELICSFFVASWTGVVKYHGPRPSMRPKQVFVCNHTSMIDFIILEQMTAFAVIMQKHPGWVGLLQSTILESVGCIWFNRSEAKDRETVARKLRDHVQGADNNPLLIFPEGTCVNNHYTVMFKKGAFELGCTVCPIAIKYNKIFVDAFWNSRKQSFTMHLLQLMTSWAVVCDVWYLEPQSLKPGETAIEFAERVRDIISVRAGLKKVPWDGYLKYSRPSPKHRESNNDIKDLNRLDLEASDLANAAGVIVITLLAKFGQLSGEILVISNVEIDLYDELIKNIGNEINYGPENCLPVLESKEIVYEENRSSLNRSLLLRRAMN